MIKINVNYLKNNKNALFLINNTFINSYKFI